ncbi:MAG TPA: diacylglycerol kinase family protein [Nitrososphaera sp.]|nr:diacylglycerol kinase family protein [Nitrososphaera sp.]
MKPTLISEAGHVESLRKTAIRASLQTRKKAFDTVLVVNPNSCSGLTGKNWNALFAKFKGIFGDSIKVAFSERSGHGTELTRSLLKKGFSRIVAIGGDGTINEVANGFFEGNTGIHSERGTHTPRIINPDATMGVVPCGTRNVLVKSLDLPVGIVECCRNFVGGSRRAIDVITASATDPETGKRLPPRIFLNAAEIGFPAEMITRAKKIRSKVKSRTLSTIAALIATMPSYESNLCEFFVDGSKKSMNMTMGVVANGRFLGGGFMAAPSAEVNDGLLDLVVMKDSGSFKMLDELVNVKGGTYASEDNILYSKAKNVLIKSKERQVTVTIDGEPAGVLPVAFQVLPRVLNVVL